MSNYYNPVKIVQTNNWLDELNRYIEDLIISSPIIITSQGNRKRLNLDSIFDPACIYSDVGSNPTFDDCENAIKYCNNNSYNGVIALGGGSVMDLAKVVMAQLCSEKTNIYELFKNIR